MVVDHLQTPPRVEQIELGHTRRAFAAKNGVCLQNIWYKAPEILLNILYNEGIDMCGLDLNWLWGTPSTPGTWNTMS